MSATAIPPADRVMLTQGFADRSRYVEDLEANGVEARDFFERGEGRREGAAALAGGDALHDDP